MGLSKEERQALETAARCVAEFRAGIGTRQVPPELRSEAIEPRFRQPLADEGMPADQVIGELCKAAEGGLIGMTSGRFFGYVLGGSMPVGVAADMLVAAWGQNSPSAWEAPVIAAAERAVGDWCLDLLGLPKTCGLGIVTGASMANIVGVLAARNALLARQGWDVEAKGLYGAPDLPVFVGAEAHSAVTSAFRIAGLGSDRPVKIETDDQGRMRADRLAEALDVVSAPPLVVVQAGHINSGAFDPMAEIIPLVHARGGWVHVDGAFGLWLAAVPDLRGRLTGVEAADSWATDLHKWPNAPFDAGLILVRDRRPLVAAMTARGVYLAEEQKEIWDPGDSVPELSRRGRGVSSYAILRHLGKAGMREMVARHCRLASEIAARLAAEPGITVMNEIAANQVAVTMETDALTEAVLKRVQRRGQVFPTHGQFRGRYIIRVSVINYATHEAEAALLVDEILDAKRALA